MNEVLGYYERAIKLDPSSYKAWRLWALTNFESVEMDDKVHAFRLHTPGN